MTEKEFDQLKSHDRIQFIGDPERFIYCMNFKSGDNRNRPLIKEKIYTVLQKTGNYLFLWGVSASPPTKYVGQKKSSPLGINILNQTSPVADDWKLIESRHSSVERVRKSKLGILGVKKSLRRMKLHSGRMFSYFKNKLDYYLKDVPIEQKVLLLASFKGEERKILEFLFEYKDFSTAVDQWYKTIHPDEGDNSKL